MRTRTASGFTILELMVVAAIVAVIAAIAVPNWQRVNDNIRMRTAARAAMDTFRYAHEQALRTGRRHLVFSQTGPAVDACGVAIPSSLLVLDDTDGDCCVDAAEPRWVPEEINQPAVQQTAFWGVTNATARVPEDSGAGGITTGSTFTTPAGAATAGVAFRGDGVPVTMTAGCNPGPVGQRRRRLVLHERAAGPRGGGAPRLRRRAHAARHDQGLPLGSLDGDLDAMKNTRRAGLTLLEVMVAMMILCVGLLGMLSMQMQALSSTRTGRHVSDAARVGLDRLETLKYQSWATTAPTGWTAPLVVTSADPVAAAGGQVPQVFNVSWRIQDVAGLTGVRQLDVRVTWREPGDRPGVPARRYAVSTLKCNGCGGT